MTKLFRFTLSAMVVGLGSMALGHAAAAQTATAFSPEDESLAWGPCPDFMPEGCQIAVLHGDPAKPNADIFFRVPADSVIPRHWHTSPERMVLVSGRMQVTYDGQPPATLERGDYAYGPARLPHEARCEQGDPCVLFIAFEDPVDAIPGDAPSAASTDAEARLKELGVELADSPAPVANYVNAVRTGNLVFLAGKGPDRPEGGYVTGQVGTDLTVEEGYEAARLTGITQLSVLKAELGDLDRVKRIVKVLGMVNSAPGFGQQPEVINGFSDLMVEVFGERGKHARSAVGMASLPRNIAVEIEMIVEVE